MRRRTARLCEWAALVGADLPDEFACDRQDPPSTDR